ncbi:phosphoribosylformylglycinamidine cyclo-ligase [Candidatus Ichthyocystis hellenicum]|uniref:phosphoribosylformylglycinamidine cyclo-ligase n=1 Tax=Candidatus Ichthyocystis hellenicum TaxID=1561003 RepID=UPI000AA816BE|nr:phosphoribosylformylglycinamidine cyclo-ligase [Candidatus Ichthyocystis hellenicum]
MSGVSYLESGVDISAGDRFVRSIKSLSEPTYIPGVLSGVGSFSSLFDLSSLPYKEPVLVSGTDGVGTKLKLAIKYSRHESIGIDLVAMCVNDVLVQGAKPLFFLDYFSCSVLREEIAGEVVAGIATGCRQSSCALVGGETAEMPGMYSDGDYDIAGFCVGVVEKSKMIDPRRVSVGDVVIGLASSGIHANGYSLVRHVLEKNDVDVYEPLDKDADSILDLLIEPTRIYVPSILNVLKEAGGVVHAMSHITGGGLLGNIPRVVPDGLTVHLYRSSWPRNPLFDWLKDQGRIDHDEMLRVFNNGIGFVLIVSPDSIGVVMDILQRCGEEAYEIGEIEMSSKRQPIVVSA